MKVREELRADKDLSVFARPISFSLALLSGPNKSLLYVLY